MDHEQLLSLALQLPPEQRAEIAGRLIESLDSPVDDQQAIDEAWSAEIRLRLDRLDSGEATTVSWDEARRRIWIAAGRDPDA
jgi:putative addiction module component (TIGR02574 family)